MKICLLNDSFPPLIDGVATTVINYANILTKLGDEVIVATPRYPDADYSGYPFKVLPYQSLNTSHIAGGYRFGNSFSPEALLKLYEFRPDIVHSHCPFASLMMGKHVRTLTGAPLVFTYHTKFDYDIARAVRYKTIQQSVIHWMINLINDADETWTVSEGAAESLRGLGYKKDILLMNNGVDLPKGKSSQEEISKATHSYDLPDGVPLYIFVGRLFRYKGLDIIIDALRKLDEEGFNFRMVFIGEKGDEELLKKEVADMGLDHKIFFTGRITDREELRAWYTRADLFLFPSVYDTNGIVVREAAACGIPSVLIEGSCAAEGVSDSRNGYLIKEDAQAMYELLKKLGNDLPSMRIVGDHAMNDLYMSWEDAVINARKRYEYIIDHYRKD